MDFSSFTDEEMIDLVSTDAAAELKRRGYEFGWHKKTPIVGAIYILVNPAFPNLVKIGYANDVQQRMRTLNSNSGLPDPFHCYALYHVKTKLTDLKLHDLIDMLNPTLRHTNNREFYHMDRQEAYAILSAIAQINCEVDKLILNPFSDSYFTPSAPASALSTAQGPKKGNLTFSALGIPIGATLVYIKDRRITCIVADNKNKVTYNGNTFAISALACKLLNVSAAQGGKYFMYNGETLTDMRERLGV